MYASVPKFAFSPQDLTLIGRLYWNAARALQRRATLTIKALRRHGFLEV